MVFYGMILEFIISKKGKLPNPKKRRAMVNMPILHNSLQIEILIKCYNFINVLLRTLQ
jgi:hypothetical protein